ncbi:tail fiber protein [Klebsiella phage SAA231]|nr:tail fiber protein [Klebsiella phage SAA231]
MAYSWQESVEPAGTQDIQCDIEYLDKSYIHVYLDGAETTAFTWTSSTNIHLNSALSTETAVLLIRKTEREYLYIEFASGAPFIEGNVDTQNTQFLHLAQELVEGRAIPGFYGDINMHGYRITHLGTPVDSEDATNKQYVDAGDTALSVRIDAEAATRKAADDALDVRTTNLEQTFISGEPTVSYPWYAELSADTDTVTPGISFTKAIVYVNGVCQIPGYSFVVVDDQLLFAETLPAGTLVHARLGFDAELSETYATTTALGGEVSARTAADSAIIAAYQLADAAKANKGANSDITSLSGLTTPLSIGQGGTGNTTGLAASATKLQTARALSVDLGSTSPAVFDGTADTSPGVTGILPVSNGGTGADSASAARTALGAAASGANTDITSITGSAATLTTPRSIQTNLTLTSASNFDGSADVTPGVSGILGVANGGTGANSAGAARTSLGAAASGSNGDITALTGLSSGITGVTTGAAPSAGIVGEVLSAVTASAITLTSGSLANLVSLSLPAGEYELESAAQLINAGNVTAFSFGVSTASATLPSNWYDVYSITTTLASGTSSRQGMSRRIRLSATTTVYLVVQATFTSTCTALGYIRAMRVR